MGHKYIAKVKTGSGTRYFYTAEEYAAYKHDTQKYGDRGNAAKSYAVRKSGTKSNSVNRPNTRNFATKKAVHPGNDRGNAARDRAHIDANKAYWKKKNIERGGSVYGDGVKKQKNVNSPKAVVKTKKFEKVVKAAEKQKKPQQLSSKKTLVKKGFDLMSDKIAKLGSIVMAKVNKDKANNVSKKLNSWIKRAEKKYDAFKKAPLVSHETKYESKIIKDEINGKTVYKDSTHKKSKTAAKPKKKKKSLITHQTTYGGTITSDTINGKPVKRR